MLGHLSFRFTKFKYLIGELRHTALSSSSTKPIFTINEFFLIAFHLRKKEKDTEVNYFCNGFHQSVGVVVI